MATQASTSRAVDFYRVAKLRIERSRYVHELFGVRTDIAKVTEPQFLAETAWVILNSGFKESVVRQKFSYISMVFFDWESADKIAANSVECVELGSVSFGNLPKLNAIVDVAEQIHAVGYSAYLENVIAKPVQTLMKIPYIGKITVSHLMKNVGFDVAKNDRHLARFSCNHGFTDAKAACHAIMKVTGDPVWLIDQVIWRYMASFEFGNEGTGRITNLRHSPIALQT